MISKEEVNAKVDAAFDNIVKAALEWKPSKENAAVQAAPYPAKKFKFTGTYADVNKMFERRKWSLGLPIIPPTVDKVQAMLAATKRDPGEVLWVVPPRNGMLTVELVATLGVMAGAQPEHMPLLLATAEAMADPDSAWRGTSTTTAPTVPVLLISGPVVEQFKLNYGTGTSGPLNPVTNALGYFINLVGDVVGGSVVPNLDKSAHGSPGDFVAHVYVENAKANPWKTTFAAEEGAKPEESVVSLFTCYPGNGNIDHNNRTGSGLLDTFALGTLASPIGIGSCFADYNKPYIPSNSIVMSLLVLCPEHAATIAKDFPTIESAQNYLLESAKMPFRFYAPERCVPPAELNAGPDTMLPRFVNPKSFRVFVSGGPGKQSWVWGPFTQVLRPVTKVIKELPAAK
ncbi:MAG: thiol-disulfide oxidoreductase [Mailhella sp.]|nr:thiol-disulfide oxidoreductase [Mailhella sp.]